MYSKVARIIRYFVEQVPGCGRTRLVKFLYLSDHEARRYLGRPITDLAYRWDNYGPYDPEILRQIETLTQDDYLREERHPADGYVWYRYHATSRMLPAIFSREEAAILDHVRRTYADLKLESLLEDVVYQTRPMLEASHRGETLRMELVDNEQRIPGLELERMIEAIDRLDAGEGRRLEDVLADCS